MKHTNTFVELTDDVRREEGEVLMVFPNGKTLRHYVQFYPHGFEGQLNELRCNRVGAGRVIFVSHEDPRLLHRLAGMRFDLIVTYRLERLSTYERSALLRHERRAARGVRTA